MEEAAPISARPVSAFRGGISIGSRWWLTLNLPWPCALLEISQDSLSLSYFGITIRFAREDIEKLVLARRYLITGVQIIHRDGRQARYVLFSTLSAKRVLAHAQYLGYAVSFD